MKLKIDGSNYNLNFGLGAFELAGDKLGMSPDEITLNVTDSKIFNHLVYCAMVNALKIEDEYAELPFSYHKFLSEIEQMPEEINNDIVNAFLDTVRYGKTFRERLGLDIPEEATTKKKATKKSPPQK